MGSKVYITLDVEDKGTGKIKKFGANVEKAFDKIKMNAKAGATQAGKMERAWKSSIDHLKRHWKAYAVGGVAAIYGVTKMISGAITKMKEYVGMANVQEAAERKLGAVLKATGNAAGYNLDQLKKMASGMQSVTTVGDEVTLSGMAILATFKQIRGEGFERATKAAMDMSAVMGQDLKSSMVMIGKAVNDPITGMSMLTRVGVTFTDQQKDMARQLQESGDMAGAQNIILQELESQFGGTAAALREDFGGAVIAAGNALGDTKEEMGFLITKNQFFIDIVHLAEKQFMAWGEKIKENRGYLQGLLKSGVLKLVDGIIFVVKTMRFFHNAWLGIKLVGTAAMHALAVGIDELVGGIRFLLTPIDMLFEGLKKLGIIKVNPFDKIEESLGQFRVSSADVTKDVMDDIVKTNKTYDLVIDKVESWQTAIKAIPVEQIKTEKQITKSIKKIGKVQATATKAEIKAAKNAAKIAAKIAAKLAKDSAKIAQKLAKDKAKAIKDYAKESTKIYDRMYDDVQKLDLGDYAYSLKLLAKRYTNYKDHLESLARQDKKYSGGVQLLDQWMAGEKQKLWDDWARKHGTVLDRMEVRWRDYQKEAIDANTIAYDAISAGAAELEKQLSDVFFDIMTGNMDKVKFDWDAMWKSMVRSTADHMAQIVAETALDTAAKAASAGMDWLGTAMGWWAAGSWEIKKQHMAMLHPGEMVIPADMAEKVRASSAGKSNIGLGTPMTPEASITIPGSFRDVYTDNAIKAAFLSSIKGFTIQTVLNLISGIGLQVNPLGVIGTFARAGFAGYMGTKDAKQLYSLIYGENARYNPDQNVQAAMQSLSWSGFDKSMASKYGMMAINNPLAGRSGGGGGSWGGGPDSSSARGSTGVGTGTSVSRSSIGRGGTGPGSRNSPARYGGIFRGPESGYPGPTMHGVEAVVPLRDGNIPVSLQVSGADSKELLDEIKKLRTDLQAGNYTIARNTLKIAKIMDKFDGNGLPAERT